MSSGFGTRASPWSGPLPRSRENRSRRLPAAAHEPSGFGAGVLAALEDGGAGDQSRLITFGSLYEALAAGGEVVDDLGRVQAQAVEIDQVDVGALPGLQASAVVEAEEIGGLARLALHHVFERQTRPTLPVSAPMGQHVGRRARVDDHRDMRAAVSEPKQCAWVDEHLTDWLVIVPSVAGHRKE